MSDDKHLTVKIRSSGNAINTYFHDDGLPTK